MFLPPPLEPAVELVRPLSVTTASPSHLPLRLSCLPLIRAPCDYIGPTWRSRDNLLIARSLLPCEVTYSQAPGLRGHLWRAITTVFTTQREVTVSKHTQALNKLPRSIHPSHFIGQSSHMATANFHEAGSTISYVYRMKETGIKHPKFSSGLG